MDPIILFCSIAFIVLVLLIIYGAMSSKKQKNGDTVKFHVVQVNEPLLHEIILSTLQKDGYLFSGSRVTKQDEILNQMYAKGTKITIKDEQNGTDKVYVVEKAKRHSEPSVKVSGECWVYEIYFSEFEGTELPMSLPVLKSSLYDAVVFTKESISLVKDNQTIESNDISTLKGNYVNDYLTLKKQDGSILHLNPGLEGKLGQKSDEKKLYLSAKNFETAKQLIWKYVDCTK